MSEELLNLKDTRKEWHGTVKGYIIGFLGSLILTGTSFLLVIYKTFEQQTLIYTIVGLALIQAIIQLIFFLHLGKEPKPRLESQVFYFMLTLLIIIVLGTLWIMYDLDKRTMINMSKEMTHD